MSLIQELDDDLMSVHGEECDFIYTFFADVTTVDNDLQQRF